MEGKGLDVQTRTVANVTILSLNGRFDAYNSSLPRRRIEDATAAAPANLVVNLKDVQFIDSTALSILVQGYKRSRQLNGDLRLCCVPPSIRMILELTRLDKVFEIFLEEEDAVQAFQQIVKQS